MDGTLLTILENSLDPSSSYFVEAQRQLQHAKEVNLPEFIRALSDVIVNPQANLAARHLAGILIKNCFERDFKQSEEQKAKFLMQTTPETLHYIKMKMLNVMKTGTEAQPVLAACTVISRIAEIELSRKSWPEFFDIILGMVESGGLLACRSSLTCLSYLIEDLYSTYETQGVNLLSKQESDRLLTSLIKGVYMEDIQSRRMALRCLQNLLPFVHSNMEVPAESEVIVEAICRNCALENDHEVRAAAYDCLVQLVSDYYNYISPCLAVIVPFLWQAIDSGEEKFAIPAFEFWNTVCETEISLAYDNSEQNQRLIHQVIPFLLPKILHTMTLHRFEELDSDTWTLPMAAGLCLSLCSQAVKNEIVHSVLQFVKENFQSPEWNKREAAVLAYGYIMEGPDTETLRMLVRDSFDHLCDVLRDQSIAVQDTAAWTIGRIASFHCEVIVSHLGSLSDVSSNLSKILRALFQPPRVAVNICWFFHELADGIGKMSQSLESQDLLDTIFPRVCDALVQRANGEDAMERNLFTSAYSSLCSLAANVSMKCKNELNSMLNHFEHVLAKSVAEGLYTQEQRTKQDTICGVIQVLLTRVDSVPNLQSLWHNLSEILSIELSEDALLTMSALINQVGSQEFLPYLPRLSEIVIEGLKRPDLLNSCKICVELTSDMARVMENLVMPYIPHIMELLLNNLSDFGGPKQLKPPIVTALGDIAMAIGGGFGIYVEQTMGLLLQAAATSYEMGPADNEEWIWYINDLREGALQAFTGIAYGLKEGGQIDKLRCYVSSILQFVQQVVETPAEYFSSLNYRLAVALVGDLVNAFGSDLSRHLVDSALIKSIAARLSQLESSRDKSFEECQSKVVWLLATIERH